mmetsp:Transcript_13659/g.29142  ORF Transcript_13659/g.29142 Transcript_13659/m.29142 type:complete len:314 (-) Transcript_13659:1157-2098(-)
MEVPTSTAVGVARPSAHGHATTSTLHASCRARRREADPGAAVEAPATTAGKRRGPASFQKAKVAAEAPITLYTNVPDTLSASRCTGAVRACASSTIWTMSESTVSSPLRTTSTVRVPSQLMVPAETVSPASLVTGSGSPVNAASSTLLRPRTTTPSTATRSPGRIWMRSPGASASVGTSEWRGRAPLDRSCPLARRRAVVGRRLRSWVMSEEACSLARSSTARPSSTKASSITGSSKNVGHPSLGTATATALMVKEAIAPRETRVFMLGVPRVRLFQPSMSVCRPGPSSANTDRIACAFIPHSMCTHFGMLGR